MTTGRERRILPIAKIWKGIRHPRSLKAKSNVREPQQTSSRPVSRERRNPSLGSIWTRIRHPQFHRTASTPPVVEVAPAQAKRFHLRVRRQQLSLLVVPSDMRHSYRAAAASGLPHEATARKDTAQSSRQAGRPGHEQRRVVIEDRESVGSGNVYAERDTESVRAHGCWNIFWNWLCYKAF
ncbi:hypothetical protein CY34DRAFT_628868 [Suillus luteus UH-Slu-Lm8-n1]|uniref:Uncharacterized protein n=1 Tax=Suillus luteus UH-Slu-Lm8-n1 TaxID=930992 RepID=A0A0D0BSC5_9AGAM|nr:hypothetical protein CY34DRAFT_628868 [Suillus luteus UH-Slu-Lm8-n1]